MRSASLPTLSHCIPSPMFSGGWVPAPLALLPHTPTYQKYTALDIPIYQKYTPLDIPTYQKYTPLDIPTYQKYTPLDIPTRPGHIQPIYTYLSPWKGPGSRDIHPQEETWDQGYPFVDRQTLMKTIPSHNFVGGL